MDSSMFNEESMFANVQGQGASQQFPEQSMFPQAQMQMQPMMYPQEQGMFPQMQGQPMMCPQGYPMNMQNMYYNMPFRGYSKQQIIQALQNYVVVQSKGTPVNKIEKLDDQPSVLRHACYQAKVSGLGLNYFPVPEMNMQVPFYFCTACGKLYIIRDFM